MNPTGQAGGSGQAPTPAAPAVHGQAPTSALTNNQPAPGGPPNGQAPTATPDTYIAPTADEWRRHLQELAEARRDAGKYRDEIKKRDDATLTAEQKRERDLAESQTKYLELELRAQRLSLENAAHRLGPSLGIADVPAALALVQVEHATDLEYDDDGMPKHLDKLLAKVLEAHPFLAGSGQGQGNGQPGQPYQPPQPPRPTAGGPTAPPRSQTPPQPGRQLRTFNDVEWTR